MLSNSTQPFPKATATNAKRGFVGFLKTLHSIEFGKPKHGDPTRIGPERLANLLRLLLMLLENGLSLPKALGTLAADRSSRKYRDVLHRLRLSIEAGGSLSHAMERYPRIFTPMQVQQIKIGERTGALEMALSRVCEQTERSVALRKRIIKKVSYPLLVTLAGSGLMIFMCVVVVPEFESVYASSNVDLPLVTRVVTGMSRVVLNWGWICVPIGILAVIAWVTARSQARIARVMDSVMLRVPLLGPWLRDAAVLQFADTISSMVECGYKPVDSIEIAVECVRNREIRAAVEQVRLGVRRGEKLSVELGKHERFFSATFCQLIGVGEQSGNFQKAIQGTCNHLRERLETRIDTTVGLLEPTLTILLAIAIGGIVLSIYTPMFHMFEVLE